jgi:IS5 family transposase
LGGLKLHKFKIAFEVRSERQLEKWLNKRATLLALFKLRIAPDHSTFSRFRKRLGKTVFAELFAHLVKTCESLGLLAKRLIGQDSTDFKAYANRRKQTDSDARFGHVTWSEELVYGYKAHYATDLVNELPVSLETLPANEHDSVAFNAVMHSLLHETVQQTDKFVADSAFDTTEIREDLRSHNVAACIAVNGRGHYASSTPKDADYGKRSACERCNSRAKEFHRLDNLKLRGLGNAAIHAALSLSALLLNAVAALVLGIRWAARSPLAVRAVLE